VVDREKFDFPKSKRRAVWKLAFRTSSRSKDFG